MHRHPSIPCSFAADKLGADPWLHGPRKDRFRGAQDLSADGWRHATHTNSDALRRLPQNGWQAVLSVSPGWTVDRVPAEVAGIFEDPGMTGSGVAGAQAVAWLLDASTAMGMSCCNGQGQLLRMSGCKRERLWAAASKATGLDGCKPATH